MRLFLTKLLLIVIISGCIATTDHLQEENIINDIFMELVGTEFYYPITEPPAHLLEKIHLIDLENDSIKYADPNDTSSIKQEMDSKILILGMQDSLFRLKDIELDYFNKISANNIDDIYLSAFNKLVSNKLSSKYIDKSLINNTGRYKLIDDASNEIENSRTVGYIHFSRIFITTDSKHALFYFKLVCGGECGQGDLVFISYDGNKWNIEDRYFLWVS